MKHIQLGFVVTIIAALFPVSAWPHASEQGFVLLLPTDLYTGAGVVAVALTLVVLALAPQSVIFGMFRPFGIKASRFKRAKIISSCASCALLIVLIYVGLFGPRNPLENPLSLSIWTVFWIGMVLIQALVFDLWAWVNPIFGPLRVLGIWTQARSYLKLPRFIGHWPAVAGFFIFGGILLADPAPADPNHLARLVAGYWGFQFAMAATYGPRWIARGEVFTVFMTILGQCSVVARVGRQICIGLPGWQISKTSVWPIGLACLCVAILGTGSFDGVNETFWWLGQIGINPLEFPGRAAVIWQSLGGLFLANLLLFLVFALTLTIGQMLASLPTDLCGALKAFAPTLLPIAIGYHFAHYLPSFLVDSQWTLVAISDPLMVGADIFGLGEFYVSTGFFNSKDSVRNIYLAQTTAVVLGHLTSVLLAHATALRVYGEHKKAVLSQIPLSVFMVAYTFFGLWLLASPRF